MVHTIRIAHPGDYQLPIPSAAGVPLSGKLTSLEMWGIDRRRNQTHRSVTNSEQKFVPRSIRQDFVRIFRLASLGSRPEKDSRGGTRIPCGIPVTLTSLDPSHPFTEPCQVILANLSGCAVRSPLLVPPGTVVQLEGLPTGTEVAARVINCISLGEFEHLWLLGLALNESGNVWGIESTPEDWGEQ
jgi:hypothetical protein